MIRRLTATSGFFVGIARDAAGTLRARWRRFQSRVVHNRAAMAVGVDVYPFFERMTGVGWYEWNLLAALDRRDDGISYNLYARTFLAPLTLLKSAYKEGVTTARVVDFLLAIRRRNH